MLEKRFEQHVLKTGLVQKGRKILVGFSGGSDSTALLHLLVRLGPSWNLKISAAHLNHGLRGRASDRDAQWAAEVCRKLGITLFTEKVNVTRLKRTRRLSLEEAAREARYGFFRETCLKNDIPVVALAHTADDQVETTLLFLLRGAGRHGLAGMPASRPMFREPSLSVVRPLLGFWKQELTAYLKSRDVSWREDETNHSDDFLRNRVRRRLIPMLRSFNPAVKEHLLRLSGTLGDEEAYLEKLALDWMSDHARKNAQSVAIPSGLFRGLARPLQIRVMQGAIRYLKGNLGGITRAHLEGMVHLLADSRGQVSLDLPEGLRAQRSYGAFELRQGGRSESAARRPVLLKIPGRTSWKGGPWVFDTRRLDPRDVAVRKKHGGAVAASAEYFDLETIALPLALRAWKKGDRLRPFGFPGRQKLQDLFTDRKVPRDRRGEVPLLVDRRDRILWAVGMRRAEEGRVTPATRKVIEVTALS